MNTETITKMFKGDALRNLREQGYLIIDTEKKREEYGDDLLRKDEKVLEAVPREPIVNNMPTTEEIAEELDMDALEVREILGGLEMMGLVDSVKPHRITNTYTAWTRYKCRNP